MSRQRLAPTPLQTGLVYGAISGLAALFANLTTFFPAAASMATDTGLAVFGLGLILFFLAGRRAGKDEPGVSFAGAEAGGVAGLVYGVLAGSLGTYLGTVVPYGSVVASLLPQVAPTALSPGEWAVRTASLALLAGLLGGAMGHIGSATTNNRSA